MSPSVGITANGAASCASAIAISTNAKWKPKVQADIATIAATQRAYTVAYFITSQHVKDKDRANVELESAKAPREVVIIDSIQQPSEN